MRRTLICFLGLFLVYASDVMGQTRADTLDARYITAKLDTLQTANGVGARRNLATAARARVAGWLARVDTVRVTRVDTVYIERDSVTPPPVNQPPVAAFVLTKNDTTRVVRMTNQSRDPEGGALTYFTRWSDGTTSTALNPSRTFAEWGVKSATLVATDNGGKADTASVSITLVQPTTPNTAPVARLSASCADLTRSCAVNASASTDDKLVTSYAWQFGDGGTATGVTATHSYAAAGAFTIRLTVRDAEGLTATRDTAVSFAPPAPPPDTAQSIAAPAALPRSTPSFTVPAPTRVVTVPAGGNLQAALDNAVAGDELRLTAGATYTGNFTFRACPTTGWITVTTATTLPAAGVRVTPATAASFARILSPNFEPALRTTGPACQWRIVGVEIFANNEGTGANDLGYGILKLGGGGDEQTAVSQVPQRIIVERAYIHGSTNHNDTRCVVLNSANTIIRDSWISDCHARGSDSQAILGWNGPGPYLIENNYLAGAGENIMFGGADPAAEALVPSDITIRRNHLTKPLAWKGVWDPNIDGFRGPWTVKNLLELKTARRVLIEANVLEHVWPAGQEGMAVVIKSANAGCAAGTCPWVGTQDVTLRNNIVRNAAVGLNLQAADPSYGHTSFLHVARVTVTDNLFAAIGAEGRAALVLATGDLADITIHRNTFLHDASVGDTRGGAMIMDYGNGAARRLDIRANLLPHGAYGVFYTGGSLGAQALSQMAGSSYVFTGNVVPLGGPYASKYPAGNLFPATVPAVDLSRINAAVAGVVVP